VAGSAAGALLSGDGVIAVTGVAVKTDASGFPSEKEACRRAVRWRTG
jgi:hypothetical protein